MNVPKMPEAKRLGYSTNNVYKDYAPKMSDGRSIIASYQPESITNDYLKKELGIKSNWEYRKYLTENGKDIMKYNCMNVSNDVGYTLRYISSSSPLSSPLSSPIYKTPVGEEYNESESSDLKEMYLSREELDAKSSYRYNTQEELLKYR